MEGWERAVSHTEFRIVFNGENIEVGKLPKVRIK
jgi:hypothetical protein